MSRRDAAFKEAIALDGEVAEKVLGWRWYRPVGKDIRILLRDAEMAETYDVEPASGDEPLAADWYREVPRYSGDLDRTAEVIVGMRRHGWEACKITWSSRGGALVTFTGKGEVGPTYQDPKSLAVAVCRAALAALEGGGQ